MPSAARRPCAEPRCPSFVSGSASRCKAHSTAYEHQRGTAAERGYDAHWRRYSKWWLQQFPICGMRGDGQLHAAHSRCVQQGLVVSAEVTDHIVSLRQGGAQCEPSNSQSLCRTCNAWKANVIEGAGRRRAGGGTPDTGRRVGR